MTKQELMKQVGEYAREGSEIISWKFLNAYGHQIPELERWTAESDKYQKYCLQFYKEDILEYLAPWEHVVREFRNWFVTGDEPEDLVAIADNMLRYFPPALPRTWLDDLYVSRQELLPTVFDFREECDGDENKKILVRLVHLADVAINTDNVVAETMRDSLVELLAGFVARLRSIRDGLEDKADPLKCIDFGMVKHDKQIVFTKKELDEIERQKTLARQREQAMLAAKERARLVSERDAQISKILESWNVEGEFPVFVSGYNDTMLATSEYELFMEFVEKVFPHLGVDFIRKAYTDPDAVKTVSTGTICDDDDVYKIQHIFEAVGHIVHVITKSPEPIKVNVITQTLTFTAKNTETGDPIKYGVPGTYKVRAEYRLL